MSALPAIDAATVVNVFISLGLAAVAVTGALVVVAMVRLAAARRAAGPPPSGKRGSQ